MTSVRLRPSTSAAAATTNDAASRSFWVVTDWIATCVNVAARSAANAESGRSNPSRRAIA